MPKYDIQDENGNTVFTVEGDEPPTADDVEELLAAHGGAAAPAAPAPATAGQPQGGPSLFSAKTLFPGTMAAIEAGPGKNDSAMVQGQLDIQKEAPASFNMVPGGAGMPMPIVSEQSMKAGIGAVGDWFGKAFRLAGSLIPATRGKTVDEATGQERNRTFTEAIQNPNTSLTTPIDEALEKTNLPGPVKTAGHFVLGALQGAGTAVVGGAVKGTVNTATAGAREATGRTMTRVADAVQNLRLGATTKDVLDGYTPRTLAREGLNRMSVREAYQTVESRLNGLNQRAARIKGASSERVNLSNILRDVREELQSKQYDFHRQEVQNALDELEQTIALEARRTPGSIVTEAQVFTPRRPVALLTPDEIRAGLESGELRFGSRGNRLVPEYARPEVSPERSLVDEGVYANLLQANTLKTAVGKESAFQHILGRVRGDRAANASERVYNLFYTRLKQAVDPLGGEELQAINRQFSELIPVQNVLTRAMTRDELGQVLGRTDIPTTKLGLVRAAMRYTRTDRAAGLNAAGEALQRSGAEDLNRGFMGNVRKSIQESLLPGTLRGSLSGGAR